MAELDVSFYVDLTDLVLLDPDNENLHDLD